MKLPVMTLGAAAMSFGAAQAADLPSHLPPPPPPIFAPIPVFSWTGFYAGVNAGYAFDNRDRVLTVGNTAANAATIAAGNRPAFFNVDSDGFTGGGQIGYNYQFAPIGIVVGIEADAAYTDLSRNKSFGPAGPFGLVSQYRSDLDYLGTVRGRVGYAFDRFLVYGTGGFAYGGTSYRANFFGPNGAVLSASRDATDTGYVVGGGLEYALPQTSFLNFARASAVTLKAEYLYYDLGRTTVQVGGGPVGPYSARFGANGDIVRVGLNYKFGS